MDFRRISLYSEYDSFVFYNLLRTASRFAHFPEFWVIRYLKTKQKPVSSNFLYI